MLYARPAERHCMLKHLINQKINIYPGEVEVEVLAQQQYILVHIL